LRRAGFSLGFFQFMNKPLSLLAVLLWIGTASAQDTGRTPWRSALYPEDWKPDYADVQGRFLHDFSYAGYGRGESALPEKDGPATDATQPPYAADPSGQKDSTAGIQAALDTASGAGGGVVYLPGGTYRISPPEGGKAVLKICGDNVVLRGAGAGKTFLFNDAVEMREKPVVLVEAEPAMDWRAEGAGILTSPITRDVPNRATEVFVQDPTGFAAGDLVVLRSDLTQRFIDEVEMTGKWKPAGAGSANRTLMFCRRVVAVNPGNSSLTIDVPVRYPLKTADLARAVKIPGHMISGAGLEDFSLGMKQHPGSGLAENDYQKIGTLAYDVHGSKAIVFKNAENCWARRLKTYAPTGNDPRVHVLSNALILTRSRFVTVTDCDFKFPQYRGGGGNGYLYIMQGQENLIIDCQAEGGRHNYDFGTMACSGNVITHCLAKDGMHASDFHMFLSMSNLLDTVTCDGDFLEARYFRPWGGNPVHGVTTTQSVFWNTKGLRYSHEKPVLIWSEQMGEGYVIGTQGPCHDVDSSDFVEGIGRGDTLEPASLYQDQLTRRLKAPGK
jgi:hypothetical protein